MARPTRRWRLAGGALALALVMAAAACGSSSSAGSSHQLSIVSIGDSIASGEGIAYGYTYDNAPPTPHWVGGTPNPTWAGPYQQCHQTTAAYGNVVAQARHARFINLACTGSTYADGITGPWSFPPQPTAPAQFGDWATRANLNPAYDQAAPDVVLVTFGADDVRFRDVVVSCVVEAIADPNICTAQDPGSTVRTDVLDQQSVLGQRYRALAAAIQARGQAAHPSKVPFVVFTSYPNPLPAPNADISLVACPDAAHLNQAQIAYLSSLVQLQLQTLRGAVGGMRGVAVADVTGALAGHQWCSSDPWSYGASVLALNPSSNAPVHPTAQGQQAVAKIVLNAIPAKPAG
ncbi:MAG TPA: SGNH/GDSL hydrolase family protein [Acidimicrobiales bacterium]